MCINPQLKTVPSKCIIYYCLVLFAKNDSALQVLEISEPSLRI